MTTILYILAIVFYALIFSATIWELYNRYIKKKDIGYNVRVFVDEKTGLEYFLTETGGICPRMETHDKVRGSVHSSRVANGSITVMPFVGKVQ